ncbi:MAG TPA: deoxyribose-phosphate aldolase [Flavisolibacter sp.]|jgi:deoxyribose-phosphate aldolase|nr:deoxyribose-phosphate aldolase [Flavisolibacter sp.]
MSIAQFIDHTLLKSSAHSGDIEKVCREALAYRFKAVCIPPYFVRDARELLTGSTVNLATVIGFPFGYSHYQAKTEEAIRALEEGADELDMVFNLSAFRSNDLAYLETEIQSICEVTEKHNKTLKVIIESGLLSRDEIIKCCTLYRHYPIDFLKTSTGYAEKGATVEAVLLMREHLPAAIQIKASGGIRDYAFAKQLLDAGATRLGCSASIAIVTGASGSGNGY